MSFSLVTTYINLINGTKVRYLELHEKDIINLISGQQRYQRG
jgi:hypothetical protein